MSIAEIEAKIAEFDREVRAKLYLEEGDDWRTFTSVSEHPDFYNDRQRLEQKLERARQVVRLVAPTPRGSKAT